VGLEVERHRRRSGSRLQSLESDEFFRRFRLGNRDRAVAAGGKDEFGERIEGVGIDIFANADGVDHPSSAAVHHEEESISTADEQSVVFGIEGHSVGYFSGGSWPAFEHRMSFYIDHRHGVSIGEVAVNACGVGIGDGEFWGSA